MPKTDLIMVACSHCDGVGKIELTGVYAETLALLKKQSKPINAAELARGTDVNLTAMANRLAWLGEKGLATFKHYGQMKLWSAT